MIGEAAAPELGGGPITLIEGSSFCVSGRSGDIRPDQPEGLFFLDTRLLWDWQLRVNGLRPEPLAVSVDLPDSGTFVSRIRPDVLHDSAGSLFVLRRRYVGRGMREDIVIRNYGHETIAAVIALLVDVDFADLFLVKSGETGSGARLTPRVRGRELEFQQVEGRANRMVTLSFSEVPAWEIDRAVWQIEIPPGGTWTTCCQLTLTVAGELVAPRYRCGEAPEKAEPARRFASWQAGTPRVRSDHVPLVRSFNRSLRDLGSLRMFDPEHPERPVIAAGAPWFMTLFGRDSLLTAWMSLIVDPDISVGVLEALARLQGSEVVTATEEEPGRILHEVRFGKSASMALGDGHVYYGTVDATPLFVMLLGELARWGHAPEVVSALLPHADRALAWVETYGDRDGDGYVEYARATQHGLRNQGWRDSWDGVPAADGSLPDTPIALCEVQGYVFAAYVARAELAEAAGDLETAVRYRTRAEALRAAFERDFWLPDRGWYAIGLDRDKRPIDALTSNIGHCLWTGIVSPERARQVARHLLEDDMFSGWGVRTLSTRMTSYNPLSYHNGSVWPHDNAILAAGLMRYGLADEAHRIILAMLDAATRSNGRLPELFAGIARSDVSVPVAYPASCSPQAWAAAAPLLFLRTLLRFDPSMTDGRVWCSPSLPRNIERLSIDEFPLGGARLRLRISPDGWSLDGLPDGVELIEAPRSPGALGAGGDSFMSRSPGENA